MDGSDQSDLRDFYRFKVRKGVICLPFVSARFIYWKFIGYIIFYHLPAFVPRNIRKHLRRSSSSFVRALKFARIFEIGRAEKKTHASAPTEYAYTPSHLVLDGDGKKLRRNEKSSIAGQCRMDLSARTKWWNNGKTGYMATSVLTSGVL